MNGDADDIGNDAGEGDDEGCDGDDDDTGDEGVMEMLLLLMIK